MCGFLVTVDGACVADDGDQLEVWVAGCLESNGWQPDTPRVACGTLAVGQSGQIVARTAGVQWGPYDAECGTGGALYPITLHCPAPSTTDTLSSIDTQ